MSFDIKSNKDSKKNKKEKKKVLDLIVAFSEILKLKIPIKQQVLCEMP